MDRVAFHEAGHCTLTIEHGRAIRRATIRRNTATGTRGTVDYFRVGKWFSVDDWFKPGMIVDIRTERYLHRRIMSSLAGNLAAAIYTGEPMDADVDEKWDHVLARRLAYIAAAGDEAEARALIAFLSLRSERILRLRWASHVVPIARALLQRGTLCGKEIEAAIDPLLQR